MLRAFAMSLLCAVGISPAKSGEYTFCLLINRVADGGKLKEYSNSQIENGLCMATKEVVSAVAIDDSLREGICMTAAGHMMKEFKKRFPNRPANSVIGKC